MHFILLTYEKQLNNFNNFKITSMKLVGAFGKSTGVHM